MNLRITVAIDTATPALNHLLQIPARRQAIHAAMGRRVIRDTSRHVSQWGLSHPNKLGGRRTNYWAGLAGRINPGECLAVSESNATVTLDGGRLPGIMRAVGDVTIIPGTKTPGAKHIPLAARSEVYGLKPREVPGLVLFWKGQGQPGGLAEGVEVERKRDTKNGKKGSTYLRPGLVMYWFADKVVQPQDRTLLPSDQQLADSANAAAKEWVDLELLKAKGGTQ